MTCLDLRKYLLMSEANRLADLPEPVQRHLRACAGCRRTWARIEKLARQWNAIPLPESCATTKQTFLTKLAAERPRPAGRGWLSKSPLVRAFMAASLLFVLLLGGWTVWQRPEPNVVDQLVAWNLDLADSTGPDRRRLVEQESQLKTLVRTAVLSKEDRSFAIKLLSAGSALADTEDPFAKVDRFDQLAEDIHRQIDLALDRGDEEEANRLARRYGDISERGIQASLEEMKEKGLDAQSPKQWENLVRRDSGRREALNTKLEKTSEPSRAHLRKALGFNKKKK